MRRSHLLLPVLAGLGLAGCVAYPGPPAGYGPPPRPVYVAPRPPPAYYAPPRQRYYAPPPRQRQWVPRRCDRWGRCAGGYWR